MNTLPQETEERIKLDAIKANEGGSAKFELGYLCGANAEASRAQILVEALEQYISHHESGILPNRLSYDFAKLKLQQYKSNQP